MSSALPGLIVERTIKIDVGYRSGSIRFSEWISLFTLCFAPLLAHIYVGFPEYAILNGKSPKWHDRCTHLNPTSIFWRYYAISSRRVRCKSWTAEKMAITNTVFWVDGKWDGSKQMITKCRPFLTQVPHKTRISFISKSAVETLIVTLQGAQAIWDMVSTIWQVETFTHAIALPTLFSPLAIYGLLRLPAALWLTEELAYMHRPLLETRLRTVDGDGGHQDEKDRLGSWDWRSMLIGALFILYIFFFWGLDIYYMNGILPSHWVAQFTGTNFMLGITYFFFLLVTLITNVFYMFRDETGSTVIPCIQSLWYKLYTTILFLLATTVFIFACIETRHGAPGKYTTYE